MHYHVSAAEYTTAIAFRTATARRDEAIRQKHIRSVVNPAPPAITRARIAVQYGAILQSQIARIVDPTTLTAYRSVGTTGHVTLVHQQIARIVNSTTIKGSANATPYAPAVSDDAIE